MLLRAENFKSNIQLPKNYGVKVNDISKKVLMEDGFYWFNFGGCWNLYRVEDGHATAMNYTNYIGTTSVCNEAAANVC